MRDAAAAGGCAGGSKKSYDIEARGDVDGDVDDENGGKRWNMNYGGIPLSCDHLSLWFQDEDEDEDEQPPSGDVPPPPPPPPAVKGIVHGVVEEMKGEAGSSKAHHASDSHRHNYLQTTDFEGHEDGEAKEDSKTSSECRQQKRARSTEVHNLNERLRRQKLKEKMKTLQELIPNCNKRDKASTLDDAIKYIQTLQYQVQMMSMGAGFSMLRSPTTMPQPEHQAMQVPSFPPFLHAVPGGPGAGIGCGLGMGQLALPSPSSLPGISEAAHNPVNVLGTSPFVSSSMDWRPMYAAVFTPGSQRTAAALDGSSPSSQCAMSSKNESCQVAVTGEVGSPSSCSLEGQFKEGGVRARVLPSQVFRPRFVKDDRASSETAKSGDSCF